MKIIIKHTLLSICCLFTISFIPSFIVSASETVTAKSIEYFEDGTICETIIEENTSSPVGGVLTRSAPTKSGTKTVIYKNSSGATLWSVKVSASFTYNGTSSSCTSVSCTAASSNTNWRISSKSSNRSGNTGTVSAAAKLYSGSTVKQTVTRRVSLSCSKNGVLS